MTVAKIVYNACYGGFSVSEAAMRRYAELKGMTLYPEGDPKFSYLVTYWTVPPDKRDDILGDDEWRAAPMEARVRSNKLYDELTLNERHFSRHDPVLVQVVEELGDAANGRCAELRIAEVPSGVGYRIDEYDGYESVMTSGDYEWIIAP